MRAMPCCKGAGHRYTVRPYARTIFILCLSLLLQGCTVASQEPILIWNSPGGGWKGKMATMGFANVMARLGILGNDDDNTFIGGFPSSPLKITSIGTSSGSAWFSTQFFYSEQFYNRVVHATPQELYSFVLDYTNAYIDYEVDLLVPEFNCELPGLPNDMDKAICFILAEVNRSWGGFIAGKIHSVSTMYGDSTLVDRRLTPSNRIEPLQQTELFINANLAPTSRPTPRRRLDLSVTYIGPNNDPNKVYAPMIPTMYGIFNDGTTNFTYAVNDDDLPIRTHTGLLARRGLSYDDWENFYLYPPTKRCESVKIDKPISARRSGTLREPFGGEPPKVGQLAAASSTSPGLVSGSVPSVSAQAWSYLRIAYLPQIPQGLVDRVANRVYKNLPNQFQLTVCSQWPESCDKDSFHFLDGDFSDSLALHIGQTQSTSTTNRTMKVIHTEYQNALRPNQGAGFLFNFQLDLNEDCEPGDTMYWSGGTFSPLVSAQIFQEYLNRELLNERLKPITDVDSGSNTLIRYATLDVTTIDNPNFHVQAGQNVEVLFFVLTTDVPVSILFTGSQWREPLATLTRSIAESEQIASIISNFTATM